MKKLYTFLFTLILGLSAMGQEPVITMTTGKSIGSSFPFTLAAEANNTPIKVDFGDGTQLSFTIGSSETTISGTLKSTRTIKIYGTGIIAVDCSLSQLTALDVSNNNALKELDCHGNRLTSLNLTTNAALESLSCQDNQIAELDLANKTELYLLYCSSNKIVTLDVSKNSKLIDLDCNSNFLTSLDVSNKPQLEFLFCYSNRLTSIDVSNNPKLDYFFCYNNFLTFKSLPVKQTSWGSYRYFPQYPIPINKSCFPGNEIDLSSQLTVGGFTTTYTWISKGSTLVLEGIHYNITGGKTTFLISPSDSVYCQMTNTLFPNLNLKTSYTKISATGKKAQTIAFSTLSAKKVGDPPFELTATSTSALPVTFTSSNSLVASINGSTVTILMAGTVTITATQTGNDNWNPATAEQTLTITSVTSIDEEKQVELIAYPNPATDILYFKGEKIENSNVSIFNQAGTIVFIGAIKHQSINISQLPAGVYILKISDKDKEDKIIRFVKQSF